MARRAYNQFCSLAWSLDVVGERWTLLLVRELMSGPKRYTDLAGALDGIGSSLLAARLRQLEDDDIIAQRHLPPPAATTVYELTTVGTELAEALLPLVLWGARHRADAQNPGDPYRAEWALGFIAQLIDRDALAETDYTYRFRLGETEAYLRASSREVTVRPGPLDRFDATVATDPGTVIDISAGRLALSEAITTGRVTVDGDPDALTKLFQVFPDRIPDRVRITAE
ncbi:winged helix-turn-helix transcriptional regulator [Nocardia sp. NPDC127579]|uniref:winged helix-turn-helix transcriptional regulator n=1 Tax=Nocardia sp. NPDC127579 TaxID=3345402 RepID=UPI0036332BDC